MVAAALALAPRPALAGCQPIPVTDWSPTGVRGCVRYGEGTASMWSGPGAARNDCLWPWDDCTPIAVQSLDTGLVIRVTPTMYCDCYLGDDRAGNDRLVDLDPKMVAALGLDPADGLWRVAVWPDSPPGRTASLPDTALPR